MFTRPTTAAVGAMKASTAVSGVWSNTVNSDLCRLSAEQTRSGVTGRRQGAPGRGCPQGAQAVPGERGTHNIRTAPAASHRCPHTPPAPTGPAPPSSQDCGTQRRAAPPGGPAAGARAPGHTTGATRASEGANAVGGAWGVGGMPPWRMPLNARGSRSEWQWRRTCWRTHLRMANRMLTTVPPASPHSRQANARTLEAFSTPGGETSADAALRASSLSLLTLLRTPEHPHP